MSFTVCAEHSWTPHYCLELYLDDIDHFGLKFWYDEIRERSKKVKEKQ